jgi:hypothetical protein
MLTATVHYGRRMSNDQGRSSQTGETQSHQLGHKSNVLSADYHLQCTSLSVGPSKPDIPPDHRWRIPMKNLILAAVAALSLTAAVIPAYAHSTVAGDAQATRMQQSGQL